MVELLDKLSSFSATHQLLLGDLMVDRFVSGDVERVSPEAAALVLRFDHEETQPGGAAGVVFMARSLGAQVRVAGVVGQDQSGKLLTRLLDEVDVGCHAIVIDVARQTTLKDRFLGQSGKGRWQQLLRVDRESRSPLPARLQRHLAQLVIRELELCHVLLVADHDKGVCTPELLAEVFNAARQCGVPVLVDPARGKDMTHYRGADLLLPNRQEASLACGRRIESPAEALEAAHELIRRTGVPNILVKLDADGMVLAATGQPDRVFPAQNHNPLDVTGAGDMVLAVMGLCRASGIDWHEAAELASVAAGLEVGKMGAVPVTPRELRAALAARSSPARKQVSLEEMADLAEGYREHGRRVVLTNGCFDLLHAGHAAYLQEAASLGDLLVVAINDDAAIRRLKGKGRPVIGQDDRAALLAALQCVDHVLIFTEDTPHEVLRHVRPDVLVKGGDYTVEGVVGREVVEGYGGRVCVTGKREGLSTTKVLAAVCAGAAWGEV